MSRSRAQKRHDKIYVQSQDFNARAYTHYYHMLTEMAVNRFRWVGLPDSVDERFLEMCLYRNACAVFFKPWFSDEFMATQVTPSGKWNVYDNPTKYTAWGNNGFQYRMGMDKGVMIWANYSRVPWHNSIDMYARKLADIDRTIDVNLHAQKTPVVITCPEEKRLSMLNLYQQYDGNEPLILGVEGMMEDSAISVLKTDAPYLIDKLLVDKVKIMNEVFTLLGVDNSNTEKRERMVAGEVSSNNGQIEMMRLSGLNARRQACAEINKRYGLDCSVVWNHDNMTPNFDYQGNIFYQLEGVDNDSMEGGNL